MTGRSEEIKAVGEYSQLRVLVVDDTADIRELLSLYLKRCGVQVLLAENGQQALDKIGDEELDLVLMDMEMPIMDGAQASQILRARGYQGAILALTAHQDPVQAQILIDAGCNGVLEKPLNRSRLMKVLAQVSENRRAAVDNG